MHAYAWVCTHGHGHPADGDGMGLGPGHGREGGVAVAWVERGGALWRDGRAAAGFCFRRAVPTAASAHSQPGTRSPVALHFDSAIVMFLSSTLLSASLLAVWPTSSVARRGGSPGNSSPRAGARASAQG